MVLHRGREQITGIVIPAIPATELSGRVYASDGTPISGCYVSALTRDTRLNPRANLQLERMSTTVASDLAEADDTQKFLEIETVRTGENGMFIFHRLGADKYFVLARCKSPAARARADHHAWIPMIYPDATSIAGAREILLLPGDRKGDIDFHLQRRRTYDLAGKMVFSDHSAPKPWPQAIYSQDLFVVRSDRSLTSSSWLAQEPCEMNANAGTFRCDGLLPGEYTFYFEIEPALGSSRNITPQAAKVSYRVPNATHEPLKVQFQSLPGGGIRTQKAYRGHGGILDFGKVCAGAPNGRPAIQVLALGHGYATAACDRMLFWQHTTITLPKDRYRIEAFEAAFVDNSYLGYSSKFEAVLAQQGTFADVDIGRTLEPSLPLLTTSQLISIALNSLRTDH
jgi:hypothetical protein